MRLEEIRIQNYRSIDDVTLRFPLNKPVILFGSNNAGKTSILSAIQTVNTNDDQGGKLNEDGTISYTEDEIGKFFANREIKRLWQESNEAGCYAGVTDSTVISLSFEDKEGRIIEKEISFQYDSGKKKFLPKETIKALSIWPPVPAEKKYFTAAFYEKDAESKLEEGSWQKDLFDSIRNGIERSIDQVAGFQGLSLDTKQPHTAASNPFNRGDGEKSYFLRLNPLESAEKLAKLSKNIDSDTPHHLVLIDEPETHLHPNAEEALLEEIEKACQEGVQVVYATHSENFLSADNIEGFVRVYKDKDGVTKVRQLTKDELFYTCHIREEDPYKELPIGEHYYSVKINSDQLKGFFADIILLVEGQTEYYALPIYLSRTFLSKCGIQIVTCGSKSAIQTYWRLFTAYGYKCFVLYDHDTDEDKERAKDGKSDLNKELELFFNDKKQPGEGYSFCLMAACFKKNWEDYFEKDLGSEYKAIKDDLEKHYEISFAKDREKASRAKAIARRSKEIGHRDIPFIKDLRRQLEELDNMSQEDYAKYVKTVKEKLREIKNSQSKDR